MELLYWGRHRTSPCRESRSNPAFGSNGKHCRQSAGDLGGYVKFWLNEITILMSTALTSALLSELPVAEQNDCQHFVTGNTTGACILGNDMGNVFVHSKGNIRKHPIVEEWKSIFIPSNPNADVHCLFLLTGGEAALSGMLGMGHHLLCLSRYSQPISYHTK